MAFSRLSAKENEIGRVEKGEKMGDGKQLFYFVIFIYAGMGIVGYHLLKKLQDISDKLGTIIDLIPEGIDKLDVIEQTKGEIFT